MAKIYTSIWDNVALAASRVPEWITRRLERNMQAHALEIKARMNAHDETNKGDANGTV